MFVENLGRELVGVEWWEYNIEYSTRMLMSRSGEYPKTDN